MTEQSAAENIIERIDSYQVKAEESRRTAFLSRVTGGVALLYTTAVSYCTLKGIGGVESSGFVVLTPVSSLLAVACFLNGSKAAYQTSAYQQKAASLEGALAQHELATNTTLFGQPATQAELAAAPSVPPAET